jgi:hypothetical protein
MNSARFTPAPILHDGPVLQHPIDGIVTTSGHVIEGLSTATPITMLPLRLETRFAGTSAAPQLLVRIYPDDVHIDRFDPRLTADEEAYGKRHWTDIRAGVDPEQAWAQLLKDAGPARVIWVREALAPTNADGAPVFPAVTTRAPGDGVSATARALPDYFSVRVRAGNKQKIVQGGAVTPNLQVSMSFAAAQNAPTGGSPAPDGSATPTLVLDEGMRWMVDFDAAVAAGMGVAIDLDPGTTHIDDVTAVGVSANVAPADAATRLASLIDAHRRSDGAEFIPLGTPTNNLADSPSGYSADDVPVPSPSVAPPLAGSVAAELAQALGIDPMSLAPVRAADDRELDQAAAMSRALFEATWGTYLRNQAQPNFDLAMMPEVYSHVTAYLRGTGPLPTLRLGLQPYGVLPVMARGTLRSPSDSRFVKWLGGFLPTIRTLWLRSTVNEPAGPDLFALEAVSQRVRVRTTTASRMGNIFTSLSLGGIPADSEVADQLLAAELGITTAIPMVLRQLFLLDPVDLWLPMSADGDTTFPLLDPDAEEAQSVLGLLLRNSALRVAADATDEFSGIDAGLSASQVGRTAYIPTPAGFEAAPVAPRPMHAPTPPLGPRIAERLNTSAFTAFSATPSIAALAAGQGKDASGQTFVIKDKLQQIVDGTVAADLGRYFTSDALAALSTAIGTIGGIPTDRRGVFTGDILDTSSHRYDAWVTSLATSRLAELRSGPGDVAGGSQLGAWGVVQGLDRRPLTVVQASDAIPDNTQTDPAGGGFVLAPSIRHAMTSGVLRAAWRAHGGAAGAPLAPFALGLDSASVRKALALADGMRSGQKLGALLGYQLERSIHDASGVTNASGHDVEIDWVVYVLRRQFPLTVSTIDNTASTSSERLVADGWAIAQAELAHPGSVVLGVKNDGDTTAPSLAQGDLDALQACVEALLTTQDSFADLSLAESMFQLAGANYERASAATDMMGRATMPPDVFESMATPRGGRGIDQRLVVALGNAERPQGFATDTPRARLAPAADAFVAARLGAIDDVKIRLLASDGTVIASPSLGEFGLSALDLGALQLTPDVISFTDASSAETSPSSNPGLHGVALLMIAAQAAGVAGDGTTVGFDLSVDGPLVDLLEHAAAWHSALASHQPLGNETFATRSQQTASPDLSGLAATVKAMAAELSGAAAMTLGAWGIGGSATPASAEVQRRLAAVADAKDARAAAQALFGGPVVVEGSVAALPADIATSFGDQAGLLGTIAGSSTGAMARWLQDSGRVRDAADALVNALLLDELAGRPQIDVQAAQSPVEPYEAGVAPTEMRRWVGAAQPARLGKAPVISVAVVGELPASGAVVGIELDAWTEVVPAPSGSAAVAANLSAPDARAPNVILLAVPPDIQSPWTVESLFSVVDEAVELAQCRLVDFDGARRAPLFLPAAYIAQYDDTGANGLLQIVEKANSFPSRYLSKKSS